MIPRYGLAAVSRVFTRMSPFAKILILALAPALLLSCCRPSTFAESEEYPPIWPDYVGVTVPADLAPPTFRMSDGRPFTQTRELRDGVEWISVKAWKKGDRQGTAYKPFPVFRSEDPIDPYIVYRLIDPGYQSWHALSITQRRLSSYKEKHIVSSESDTKGCMNCHTFQGGDPARMILHARGKGGGTVFTDGDQVRLLNIATLGPKLQGTYPAWHPGGRYIAFSSNTTHQSFTLRDSQPIEVYDTRSDIILMDLQTDSVTTCPALSGPESLETFPAWSEDGKTLYFCSAPFVEEIVNNRSQVHYRLMAIGFEDGRFTGEPRLVWEDPEGSVSFPRCRDGRILFTHSAFGTFPIWHKEADLWMLDPRSGEAAPVEELNSNQADSYHSWSSNGKWIVFSSRRDDGRYTRLYLAHYAGDGHFDKPFLLPQKDPSHNDLRLKSYNVPEFIRAEAPSRQKAIARLFAK